MAQITYRQLYKTDKTKFSNLQELKDILTASGVKFEVHAQCYKNYKGESVEHNDMWLVGYQMANKWGWHWLSVMIPTSNPLEILIHFDHTYSQITGKTKKGYKSGYKASLELLRKTGKRIV